MYGTDVFDKWYSSHKSVCDADYHGSLCGMKVVGTERMWMLLYRKEKNELYQKSTEIVRHI